MRAKQKSRLNCFQCKMRKSNFFSVCGECAEIYCGNCLIEHECNIAINDRIMKQKIKARKKRRVVGSDNEIQSNVTS